MYSALSFEFQASLLTYTGGKLDDLNDTNHYVGNIFNKDPNFKDARKNMLIIGEKSEAINKGLSSFASQIPFDILNVNRTAAPDLGAYQHIVFPVED
mgnify:CR=1 FL=1